MAKTLLRRNRPHPRLRRATTTNRAPAADGPADPRPGTPAEIKLRDDGPYKVTGPVRLIDAMGAEFELPAGESVALCRCGQSRQKPFCDASHRTAGFSCRARAG
ncbi:MAG TPA: CDGSH iron-sulfur domain-containing protein [Solirubrobacteraceae bacterium]|nr:CDGSH iron-sulfur domain-containing protein [Solirubrobacteraceae bacterium]